MSPQSPQPQPIAPAGRIRRALSIAWRSYVALFLTGCASTRPVPTLQEARDMESRSVAADFHCTFDAIVETFQDLAFSIDTADPTTGLIVAHRQSEVELAEISKDAAPAKEEGMPTWAKVALVATGVVVVVAVIAALSDDHDDDDPACNRGDDCGDQRCARHHPRRHPHDDGHDTQVVVIDGDDRPHGPAIYSYQLTANLRSLDDGRTSVRVSGQGTRSRDGVVEKAGPVYDPDFYARLFSRLDESLSRSWARFAERVGPGR